VLVIHFVSMRLERSCPVQPNSSTLDELPFYLNKFLSIWGGRRGCDRMVVGFTTTCTISASHR
jgi:hypothetical protein